MRDLLAARIFRPDGNGKESDDLPDDRTALDPFKRHGDLDTRRQTKDRR